MRRSRASVYLLAIVGVLAFALPAAAQANDLFWYVGGKKLGGAGAKVGFNTSGKGTYKAGGITIGPCTLTDKEKLWNSGTMGEGERTAYTINVPCPTSLPGCSVAAAKPKGLPWAMTLLPNGATELMGVEIDFTFENGVGCGGLKGMTLPLDGTAKGTFNNSDSCVEAAGTSGLTFSLLGSVALTEEDCYEVAEGEEGEGEALTAEE